MNNTTRRYPRTLTEAFYDADRACAIERPARRSDWLWAALWLGCMVGIGLLLAWRG